MKDISKYKREIAAAAIVAVVLTAGCVLGEIDRRSQTGDGKTESEMTAELGTPSDAAGVRALYEATPSDATLSEVVQEEAVPVVQGEERAAITGIFDALQAGDMEGAARLLDSSNDILMPMFYETMGGGRYLFDGQTFSCEIEGQGLVFTMPGTVFFGDFENGAPQGQCLALQFVKLDMPRYNYSQGQWQAGMMEGGGITGYRYYDAVPEGEAAKADKKGNFSADRMEGPLVYESTGTDGDVSQWNMTARAGVMVLDESWSYLEAEEEYQLMSSYDSNHAYFLAKEQAEQPLCVNLIAWGED